MFSQFFIKRPIFATVVAILMVLAGAFCYRLLPVAQFPDITPPTIMVSATYPGADAETIAKTVAEPIEKQVNGVENMTYMSSICSEDQYALTVTLESGTDIDNAAVDVQNRVSQVNGILPEPVVQQGITVEKRSTNQILFISLEADSAAGYDALYLTNYARINLVEPLSRVKGVGSVQAFGGGEYDMRVWVKPQLMRIRGITPAEITAAIESQNLQVSAGSIGDQPDSGNAPFEYTVTANAGLITAEQFGNIILRHDDTGILRLKDVADVELGSSSYSQVAKVNGKQTALIGINQLPGANAIDVADGSLAELERLAEYFPEGLSYNVILNSTDYVHQSINDVVMTFAETTLIVFIVILLFLQNWRAVIIPMITIPVSLIVTLAVMKLMGFSLNTLSLFGLVLAIAIVVDDAIVVVEDCARLVSQGKLNRVQAATQAMKELTGPVVGEVLVLLSVFIPTAFITGITGSLYKQFALTIAVSTAFSGFNALTLTPALCALFLNPKKPAKNIIYRGFTKGYAAVENRYAKTIGRMLRRPKFWISVFVVFIGISVYLFTRYPSSYLPEEDMGYCMASVQLPTGASLERTDRILNGLEARFKKEIPAIKDIITISGFSMLGGVEDSNSGSLVIILKPWKERGKSESVEKVIVRMQEIAAETQQEAIFFAVNPPSVPGLGLSSGLQMELLDINGLSSDEIAKVMDNLVTKLKSSGYFRNVNSTYEAGVPQYRIVVDRDKATIRNLDIDDIYSTLSAELGGSFNGDFIDFGHTFQITLRAIGRDRAFVNSLQQITVMNKDGEMVPFGAFAKIEPEIGQSSISRYNMYTSASLTAIPDANVSSSTAIDYIEDVLSETVGNRFSYAWTGLAYQETNASSSIVFVFVFAIIMTILVLAAQYESWTSPMAVVLAMPVAVPGVLLGCFFMNLSIGIYTQIGLILLLGMAAKNAILIVEYAMDYHKAGQPILQAAFDGGRVRFRPIMMTALAFIFGVMPMMFDTGAGAGSRHEIGAAIVFGMSLNAIIGTLFVPVFWYCTQRFYEKYMSGWFKLPASASASASAKKQ